MSTSSPRHAVCVTGLQRSFPEIRHNIHYALASLYAGNWTQTGPVRNNTGAAETAWTVEPSFHRGVRSRRWAAHVLNSTAAFFGVRPANDTWAEVRATFPLLRAESIQTPCGVKLGTARGEEKPTWFSAYARSATQKAAYGRNFVQVMCDLSECHSMILADEAITGRQYTTIARLRLDLAWETPMRMPHLLRPRTIYTTRMNTKAGVNDKWAIGLRSAMALYLERKELMLVADRLWNHSARSCPVRASRKAEGLIYFTCDEITINRRFACRPERVNQTSWQEAAGPQHLQQRRFTLTSEGFLHWSLYRYNLSVAYEPGWMFCKFGDSRVSTVRICVPRMRKQTQCPSLVCQGATVDCGCKNITCTSKTWYCQGVAGSQLALDPYNRSARSAALRVTGRTE
jgi:hypothetical protein